MKIVSLVGARPQFIKEAMLSLVVRATHPWRHVLINSGQHYDRAMSDVFFHELGMPQPQYNLGVGSGTHAEITSAVMLGVENTLLAEKPDALLVYGDTDTTLGGALAAAKLNVPVIHVEAGIRMLPREMPEETNRVLTDRISSQLFCCSRLAAENLKSEGIVSGVHVCGDIMYDIFIRMRPGFNTPEVLRQFSLEGSSYIVATLHRNYNVDSPRNLREILTGLAAIPARLGKRVILPLHPRTAKMIDDYNLATEMRELDIVSPLGYLELMALTAGADFIITDSGGLQKEAYYAGKRAIVVMPDTGWRELTDCGWNILCDPDASQLLGACALMAIPCLRPENLYGDGHAAEKIIERVKAVF